MNLQPQKGEHLVWDKLLCLETWNLSISGGSSNFRGECDCQEHKARKAADTELTHTTWRLLRHPDRTRTLLSFLWSLWPAGSRSRFQSPTLSLIQGATLSGKLSKMLSSSGLKKQRIIIANSDWALTWSNILNTLHISSCLIHTTAHSPPFYKKRKPMGNKMTFPGHAVSQGQNQ